jgi:hypothetical protein
MLRLEAALVALPRSPGRPVAESAVNDGEWGCVLPLGQGSICVSERIRPDPCSFVVVDGSEVDDRVSLYGYVIG